MADITIRVLGVEALEKALGGAVRDLRGVKANRVISDAAEPVKKGVETEAPFDPKRKKGFHLNESIEKGKFRNKAGLPVAGFVRVNRKKAPHGHLVNNGTMKTRANRFFDRGVNKGAKQSNEALISGFGKILEDRFKKGGKL